MCSEEGRKTVMSHAQFREFRERMGVSRAILAKKLGKSVSSIRDYELAPSDSRSSPVPRRVADHLTRLHDDYMTTKTPDMEKRLRTASNRKMGTIRLNDAEDSTMVELRVQKVGETNWEENTSETRIIVLKGRIRVDWINRTGKVRSLEYGPGELVVVEPLFSHRVVRLTDAVYSVVVVGSDYRDALKERMEKLVIGFDDEEE